jgi:hypothetical protein
MIEDENRFEPRLGRTRSQKRRKAGTRALQSLLIARIARGGGDVRRLGARSSSCDWPVQQSGARRQILADRKPLLRLGGWMAERLSIEQARQPRALLMRLSVRSTKCSARWQARSSTGTSLRPSFELERPN